VEERVSSFQMALQKPRNPFAVIVRHPPERIAVIRCASAPRPFLAASDDGLNLHRREFGEGRLYRRVRGAAGNFSLHPRQYQGVNIRRQFRVDWLRDAERF
jgi:hypothetical protein